MRQRIAIPFVRARRTRRRSLRNPARGWRRAGPKSYLAAIGMVAAVGGVSIPYGADIANAGLGARGPDGCRVVRVVDGDTVTLWCPDTGAEQTRLVGFDTPEKRDPGCVSEYAAALRATWYLRQLIATHDTMDVELLGRDRYDRRLAVLRLDGVDLARLMMDAGHARPYSGGRRGGWCEGAV